MQDANQVGVGRLVGPLRALELEDTGAVITGIGIQEGGRRPHAIAGDAVAVGAVLAVEAVLAADDVAANRAGCQPQLRLVEARFGQGDRIVGRAEHRQEHRGDLLLLRGREPLLGRLHHVGAKRSRGSRAASDGDDEAAE